MADLVEDGSAHLLDQLAIRTSRALVRTLVEGDPLRHALAGAQRRGALVQAHRAIRRALLDQEHRVVQIGLEPRRYGVDRGLRRGLELRHADLHGRNDRGKHRWLKSKTWSWSAPARWGHRSRCRQRSAAATRSRSWIRRQASSNAPASRTASWSTAGS